MTSEGWTWEFRPRAEDAFEKVAPDDQRRIVRKLDEIVTDEWRDPPAYVEPLTGARHGRIRIGRFRLGAHADRETNTLVVYTIEPRSGAYSTRSNRDRVRTNPVTTDRVLVESCASPSTDRPCVGEPGPPDGSENGMSAVGLPRWLLTR